MRVVRILNLVLAGRFGIVLCRESRCVEVVSKWRLTRSLPIGIFES